MIVESESERYTLDGTVNLRGHPVLASRTGKWKACAFLNGYDALEKRMAFFGIGSNLVNYLSTQLHEDTVRPIRKVKSWFGSVWITPIAGVYIADAYLGLFWTFTMSSLIYVMEMILLTITVSLKSLRPTCKNSVCGKATASQEKKMKISFFNWWIFSAFTGSLVAPFGLVYIQENLGWGLGYGIPSIGLVLSLIVFYLGMPMYQHKARKAEQSRYGPATCPNCRILEMAQRTPWKPLEARGRPEVECVKLIWGMFSIWLTTLIPSMIWTQGNTLFMKQGTTLDRTLDRGLRIPSASLSGFVILSLLVCIPICDRLFVPFMRQRTGKPHGITLLWRLGIGFLLQIVTISVASAVKAKRMDVIANDHITAPKNVVPMSILWLMAQNILLRTVDVFNAIGVLEFFYDLSPSDVQSLGTTFFTSSIAVGNFMNSFPVTVLHRVTANISGKSWIGNNLRKRRLCGSGSKG